MEISTSINTELQRSYRRKSLTVPDQEDIQINHAVSLEFLSTVVFAADGLLKGIHHSSRTPCRAMRLLVFLDINMDLDPDLKALSP